MRQAACVDRSRDGLAAGGLTLVPVVRLLIRHSLWNGDLFALTQAGSIRRENSAHRRAGT